MSAAYVIIGFENVTTFDVQSALSVEFGMNAGRFLGCDLAINDSSGAYRMADRLLREQSIEEQNVFLKEFDILAFATEIHLSCGRGRSMEQVLTPLAEALAIAISARLKRRALIRIADGELPFRLYQSGRILNDYREHYADFLATSRWVPVAEVESRGDLRIVWQDKWIGSLLQPKIDNFFVHGRWARRCTPEEWRQLLDALDTAGEVEVELGRAGTAMKGMILAAPDDDEIEIRLVVST